MHNEQLLHSPAHFQGTGPSSSFCGGVHGSGHLAHATRPAYTLMLLPANCMRRGCRRPLPGSTYAMSTTNLNLCIKGSLIGTTQGCPLWQWILQTLLSSVTSCLTL